jgi:hypothetical protein
MNADGDVIAAIQDISSLATLQQLFETSSEDDAYLQAKQAWTAAQRARQATGPQSPGLPGDHVQIDGQSFYIHGITHVGTDEERSFLQDQVSQILDGDAAVYCEQGIRPLYFESFPQVSEMDDYRWATANRTTTGAYTPTVPDFGGIREDLESLSARVRRGVFEVIAAGERLYGDGVAQRVGETVSTLLGSHVHLATGDDFESFRLRRSAAENPRQLIRLQRYYDRAFLPQPLEREWLRRHDPRLERVSHARNERMADYAIHHEDAARDVHLVVGAAHGPGVRYYLEASRDDRRESPTNFRFY